MAAVGKCVDGLFAAINPIVKQVRERYEVPAQALQHVGRMSYDEHVQSGLGRVIAHNDLERFTGCLPETLIALVISGFQRPMAGGNAYPSSFWQAVTRLLGRSSPYRA
jgi:hypothetical protein